MKKLIAVFLAVACVFSCFAVTSLAVNSSEADTQSNEVTESEPSQSKKFSFTDIIAAFRQKLTAIIRIGDTIIAEAGAEKNESDRDYSTYIEILGYPLQQIIHFFQSIKEYF